MASLLIVDDALIMRNMIKAFLSGSEHEVIAEASNGEDAIQAYFEHKPDLVTMDINMPGLSGMETMKYLVAQFPGARVVMLTALGRKELIVEAIRHGAKGYITKPFDQKRLIKEIDEALKR